MTPLVAPAGAPAFLALHRSGELAERARRAKARLRRCGLCPQDCHVDRLAGELGVCHTGASARVHGNGPHFGEESPLVGRGGSGTIFFAGCNLACVFCQNYDISQPAGHGPSLPAGAAAADGAAGLRWEVTPERLAQMMLELQTQGCENLNFVSPSHVVPQILEALVLAAEGGLRLPLVYNTGGYDALSTLRLLDGVIDIYMPDMKYADDAAGARFSGVADYARCNQAAVLEMHRQVGDLQIDRRGIACRGLLVRCLVLPNDLAGTAGVARFLAGRVSPDTYLNVMDQYRPAHRARAFPDLARPVTMAEYHEAVRQAAGAGLWRLDGTGAARQEWPREGGDQP